MQETVSGPGDTEDSVGIRLDLNGHLGESFDELLDGWFNEKKLKFCHNGCEVGQDPIVNAEANGPVDQGSDVSSISDGAGSSDESSIRSVEAENTPNERDIHKFIHQAPEVLFIHIDRIDRTDPDNPQKIMDQIDYPMNLSLGDYTPDLYVFNHFHRDRRCTDILGRSRLRYRLYGVVAHEGEETHEGHYVAGVRAKGGEFPFAKLNNMNVRLSNRPSALLRPTWDDESQTVLLFYVRM